MISLRSLVLVAFAPLALAACGGGGTVALELTDAPVDPGSISKVDVSLGKVEIQTAHSCHGDHDGARDGDARAEEGEWIAVNDKAGTFDLLSLQNGVTAPLGEVDVWGGVRGIRMQIDRGATNQVVLNDGTACALDTTGVTEAKVMVAEGAEAVETRGGKTTIVLDFVVTDSIEEVSACNFKLNPVLLIKSVEHEDD